MKTSFKLALAAVTGFAVGVAAGFFFKGAEITSDLAQGDVSKVSKFSKNVVSPAMSAFQEKIISNPEELEKATVSLTVLTSRMAEFDELVNIAVAASEGNEELANSINYLQKIRLLASNARNNGTQALEALGTIAKGNNSSVDYEQASQNLALAFLMVDRQISVGKQYVCDVDAFLRGKNVEDYKELAMARDLWARYCAGEAILANNSEELAYWSKQQSLLSVNDGVLADYPYLDHFDHPILKQCQDLDREIGLIGEQFLSNLEQFEHMSGPDMQMLSLSDGLASSMDVNQMMLNVLPGNSLLIPLIIGTPVNIVFGQ